MFILASFDFVQWVQGPTHGHILDLVLSHGIQISEIETNEI